ncbi:MAG: HEPN domain-containing protein [Leptolyngbyaceae cyanobacterium]
MKPLTQEWIEKAEGDFRTAGRELRAEQLPNYDAVCFHAQQCAEKYLEARLQETDIPVPKIHDLTALLDLLLPHDPELETLRFALGMLTDYAVAVRYPGFSADQAVAEEVYGLYDRVRQSIRQRLSLS